jgi:hypothetical protein
MNMNILNEPNNQNNTLDQNESHDQSTIHKYILDPLSVIIKLAILSKKRIGCKICIYNNIFYIQEIGIFQSFVRFIFKNNKVDIQYLYNPIQLACIKFLNKDFIKNNPHIIKIFINAQKGIQNLIETYNNFAIITHTLYMYYNIIANHLGNLYNENLFIKDNMTIIYNNEIVSKLNTTWTNERIKIVLDMVDFINNDKDSENSVKCLEEFMIIIDKEVEMNIVLFLIQ